MKGMNASTGKSLDGLDHLRQSIRDILSTPIGTRVMRRDYGSRLFELVDRALNRKLLLDLYAATAEALATWEPRIKVERVEVSSASPGRIELNLFGEYLPNGKKITVDGIEVR